MLGYDIQNARINIRYRYPSGLFHLWYDYPGANALTLQDMERVCIFSLSNITYTDQELVIVQTHNQPHPKSWWVASKCFS